MQNVWNLYGNKKKSLLKLKLEISQQSTNRDYTSHIESQAWNDFDLKVYIDNNAGGSQIMPNML